MSLVPQVPPQEKWFFKTPFVILAFLSAGPLALPLVWFHPRYPRWVKLGVSIVVLILSYFLAQWIEQTMRTMLQQYEEIFALLK